MPSAKDLPSVRPVPGKKGMYMDDDSPKAGDPVGSMFEIMDGLQRAAKDLQKASASVKRAQQASTHPNQVPEE